MVHIKQKGVYGVEIPLPRSLLGSQEISLYDSIVSLGLISCLYSRVRLNGRGKTVEADNSMKRRVIGMLGLFCKRDL